MARAGRHSVPLKKHNHQVGRDNADGTALYAGEASSGVHPVPPGILPTLWDSTAGPTLQCKSECNGVKMAEGDTECWGKFGLVRTGLLFAFPVHTRRVSQ
jgi:hypothetical protein